ncbi:MAG: alpha/beta hydrolase [Blastocatellia bacterium]|nr:alpha/beta hydrolase [Blastocatellia bacterium]
MLIRKTQDLLRDILIFSDSVSLRPWKNITAVFGETNTWHCNAPRSEYKILKKDNFRQLSRLGSYLKDALIPRLQFKEPKSIYIKCDDSAQTANKEAWFFVNGVATNEKVAKWNGKRLRDLFKRPITVLFNPTNGLGMDLIECIFDRTLEWTSEPAKYVRKNLAKALKEKEKVIVIAHSQGGIIVAAALEKLAKKYQKYLRKLEIYTFACPADEMATMAKCVENFCTTTKPYLEHFVNKQDLVAKLGVLRTEKPRKTDTWGNKLLAVPTLLVNNNDFFEVKIEGDVYVNNRKGHLLNAHYLFDFEKMPYKFDCKHSSKQAKLYRYLDGGCGEVYIGLIED